MIFNTFFKKATGFMKVCLIIGLIQLGLLVLGLLLGGMLGVAAYLGWIGW